MNAVALERELEALLASLEASAEEAREAKAWLVKMSAHTDRPAGLPSTPPDITRMGWR